MFGWLTSNNCSITSCRTLYCTVIHALPARYVPTSTVDGTVSPRLPLLRAMPPYGCKFHQFSPVPLRYSSHYPRLSQISPIPPFQCYGTRADSQYPIMPAMGKIFLERGPSHYYYHRHRCRCLQHSAPTWVSKFKSKTLHNASDRGKLASAGARYMY